MSDTLTRNRELFYQVAEQIETEPQLYEQLNWRTETDCGTAFCVFGWAVEIDDTYRRDDVTTLVSEWENPEIVRTVENAARDLLGLTRVEASVLSSPSWGPPLMVSVPDALRAIGDGASVESVTGEPRPLT